jgi:hypothetical protein
MDGETLPHEVNIVLVVKTAARLDKASGVIANEIAEAARTVGGCVVHDVNHLFFGNRTCSRERGEGLIRAGDETVIVSQYVALRRAPCGSTSFTPTPETPVHTITIP